MGDSQGSGISNFSEVYFIGTPVSQNNRIGMAPDPVIPEVLQFSTELKEEKDQISIQGSLIAEQEELVPIQPVHTQIISPVRLMYTTVPTQDPSPVPIIMTTKEVIIDGVTFAVSTTHKAMTRQAVLFPKSEHKTLDKKERNTVYARSMAKHHKLIDLISLAITSEDELDDTYNLEMLIEHMRSYHADYVMEDVYKVVISWGIDPVTGDLNINESSKNVYNDYSNLAVEKVPLAQSNECYRTYVADETFTENLILTLDYMKNNVTENVWNKILERYEPFHEKHKGGSLFFKLMLNQLLSNTELAAKGNVPGEEAMKVTSHISSAINRLKHIGKLPKDMSINVLTIMQTNSVSEFNKVFAAIEVQKTRDYLNLSSSTYVKSFTYSAEDIIYVAEAQYPNLFEKGEWTGATTRGQDSAFPEKLWSNAKLQKCDNCGKPGFCVNMCPTLKDDCIGECRLQSEQDQEQGSRTSGIDLTARPCCPPP
jgi:hypothetical protein